MLFQSAFEQRRVRNVTEIFRDEPDRLFCAHPIAAIEPSEIHRLRKPAEGSFAAQIEIDVEITERQFAQRPINRLAIPAPDEIRFRDRAPMPARFENGEDMIGILVRFEVENERRKSKNPQGGRGEDCAFEAMGGPFAQNEAGRPGRSGKMVWNSVEK